MKLPFVRRKKHEASLLHEKTRRVKAKESGKRAKKSADRAKKKVKQLEGRITELLGILEIMQGQLAGTGAGAGAVNPAPVSLVNGDLRALFALKLKGEGIEIGALHYPLRVPPGVKVRYVDKRTKKENEDTFPELASKNIVETHWIGDGQWLEGMADESQDFVIANHMLEHCVNPLKTLEHFLRVLRPEGRLFIALPDKRFTFDVERPLTPFEHVLQDYRSNRQVEDREMYEEYRDFVDASFDVDKALQTKADIHHHVWTQAEVLEFFTEAKRKLGWPLEIELFGSQGIEVVLVMQKIEPILGDHAKRFAPAAANGGTAAQAK
ncbi:methyltransferase domain-containing protein [Roseimicrobium sp. ORNL1]|uniref:methyltransferase domain-containing protein n=1 Tax=Roseimicrobium sp. ORNL1 TaxID=2711231 RepID=UPI0013E1E14B|nr:methyltransferase domain-containing protein [Roseimicrobium sp. ORNL1]QIF04465.1 class I SAM-dependent methyltransferase [Roseimicrobium sp. ORNL1]